MLDDVIATFITSSAHLISLIGSAPTSAVEDVFISRTSSRSTSDVVEVSFLFLALNVVFEDEATQANDSATAELTLSCEILTVDDVVLDVMTKVKLSGLSVLSAILLDLLVAFLAGSIPFSIFSLLLVLSSPDASACAEAWRSTPV